MADASARRRGHGEDSIYFDSDKNRYIGAVSVGFGPDGKRLRRKVSGKTKQEVRDKLRALHAELDAGVQSSAGYTVRAAVDEWLGHGLPGCSARTVQLYRDGIKPLTDRIGNRPLRRLSAADVRSALAALSEDLSTRSLQIAHNCLERAIRHAEADDLVGRNVAALVRPPEGQAGRPSKALTVEQSWVLIDAAAGHAGGVGADRGPYRLHAYVVLLLTTGIRPEEARALRWDHVDLDAGTVAIWRSDRAGGDTKTSRSRRTLKLPEIALSALRERRAAQAADRLAAGELWQDSGLVFTTSIATMLDQHNIRREFRQITKAAGLGEDWVPRELRHTFVSIIEVSRIASGASFGSSREHALPAAQRAVLRRRRPARAPRGYGDLGLHGPPGPDATMMRLTPLRGMHHRCACWHRDASRSSRLHRVPHRQQPPAVSGRHRSCEGRAGLGHIMCLSWQPAALVAPGASPRPGNGRHRDRQFARQPHARRRAAVARTWPARIAAVGRRTHLTWTCYTAGQTIASGDHQPRE